MGKRIIIKGVSFASNGFTDTFVKKESTTEQGLMALSASTNFNLLVKESDPVTPYYVHTNTTITIEDGESIVLTEMPELATICQILTYKSVNSKYPALVPESEHVSIGTINKRTVINATLPKIIKNDTGRKLYVILQVKNENVHISPTNVPKIRYRIYTEYPERYQEE